MTSGIIAGVPTYAVSQDELAREQSLLNDPRWQSEREPLRDLLTRLARASSDEDFFDVHVSLVARLKARQELIGELRNQADELVRRRRGLAAITPKPIPELKKVQAELEEVRWADRVQRSLHWLLLDVGDALVWQRLGFDRAAVTALGQDARGWLSDGRGWDAEMSAVSELWNEGTLAIVNDATTCLRLGDLTCFFDDRVEVREIKAGKVVADEDPQQVRLREAITLINERRAVVDGTRRAIVRCPEPLDTYLGHLPKLLAKARERGRSVMRASRAQLVVAHDLAIGVPDRFDEAGARSSAGWPSGDVVLDWGSSLRRMRDRHYNFAHLAPMALLPTRTRITGLPPRSAKSSSDRLASRTSGRLRSPDQGVRGRSGGTASQPRPWFSCTPECRCRAICSGEVRDPFDTKARAGEPGTSRDPGRGRRRRARSDLRKGIAPGPQSHPRAVDRTGSRGWWSPCAYSSTDARTRLLHNLATCRTGGHARSAP